MSDSTQNSITVRPLEPKTYIVKAFYSNGCQPSASVKINIDASVTLNFEYEYVYSCFKPAIITFKNLSKGGANYTWILGNQAALLNDTYPELTANKNVVENMVLKSGSKEGCEFVFSKPVEIFNWDGIIPNVITPNNDKKNDTFVIGYPNSQLEIYDNWGKKIFNTPEYKNDWGPGVKSGPYYYLLKIPGGQQCKGWIEVID
jgi:gliding motility-associated-like protein